MKLNLFLLLALLIFGNILSLPSNTIPDDESQVSSASISLASAINDFAFKLVKKLDENDNLFVSPFSIYAALAMTYFGAGGRTAEQMETALNMRKYNINGEQLHEAFKEYLLLLGQNSDQYSLLVANAILVQQAFPVREEYINNIQQIYGADVKSADFVNNGQDVVNEINNWVAEHTQNKIDKLLNSPLSPMTRLVLLNAIYFKGIWETEFPRELTFEGRFYSSAENFKMVEMMTLQEETFRFCEDPLTSYEFVELPYKGNHFSMLLALPLDFNSQADLEMTIEILRRVNGSMVPTELDILVIPKFHIEYEKELKTALKSMGMRHLFKQRANLGGIREEQDLFVSSVKHKAVIDVNEEGSEAAAITQIQIMALSASFKPRFVANHPFLFYIIDNRQGIVLFAGKVINP